MKINETAYTRFHPRSQFEKSVNSLLGIIEGVAIDRYISREELELLQLWVAEHSSVRDRHPYNELLPHLESALSDHVLSTDEHADLVWLCRRLASPEYFDRTTSDIQRLHGIIGGIVADGRITEVELRGLQAWLGEHEHLKSCWPYDEIDSLVTAVMRDGKIDDSEHRLLKAYFSEFISVLDDNVITQPPILEDGSVKGVCASCPDIQFTDAVFCFTGKSARYDRESLASLVEGLGAKFSPNVTKQVDYLVIGSNGNPCWAYACYGRKVEKAVELRKSGSKIMIVHENDLHDAVEDM